MVTHGFNTSDKLRGTAIIKVIPGYRGNDDMSQPQFVWLDLDLKEEMTGKR